MWNGVKAPSVGPSEGCSRLFFQKEVSSGNTMQREGYLLGRKENQIAPHARYKSMQYNLGDMSYFSLCKHVFRQLIRSI